MTCLSVLSCLNNRMPCRDMSDKPLMCRLLKDDTFADASYILEMMTQVCSRMPFILSFCSVWQWVQV